MSVEEHFEAGAQAIADGNWKESMLNFNVITINFPDSIYGPEAYYYLGISYYYLQEYEFANNAFSEYLQGSINLRYFEEAILYKFSIASHFARGAKRRFFSMKKLPKLACGKKIALEIYDELIATVPCHQIAAESLVAKGFLLWEERSYRQAVESFQLVIRRFPKNELSTDSYVNISKVYLEQSYYEFQNPDILAFAQINLSRFERDYPRDERVFIVIDDVKAIEEIYAAGLYDTGLFYERICKPKASLIYYREAIYQFPETCVGEKCRDRLSLLDPCYNRDCKPLAVSEAVVENEELPDEILESEELMDNVNVEVDAEVIDD
jgi:outer membrane protein assembly factor BamD (BamD/ComL family)